MPEIEAMKRSEMIGQILTICGSVLSVLGTILFIVKSSSIVSIISLPVLFLGIVIWYNSKKVSAAKNDNAESMIQKF